MSSERVDDATLQQYFDGELDEAAAEAVRRSIEQSPDSQARLRGLEQLRSLISVAADDVMTGVDTDAAYQAIQQALAKTPQTETSSADRPPDSHLRLVGKPDRIEDWKIWIPVSVGLAAAAAILFVFLAPQSSTPEPTASSIIPPEREEAEVAFAQADPGTHVEEVDFGDNTGTVFELEGDSGEPIAVVWIADDFGETGNP